MMKIIYKWLVYLKRIRIITNHGWYKNLAGGFTDSHCMRVINRKELFHMLNEEFKRMI